MPPDPPLVTRDVRFDPKRARSGAPNARTNAMTAGSLDTPMTSSSPPDQPHRPENLSMTELWKYLTSNNTLENGDVVVPANLVQIMTALVITMQETTLRLNALEARLKEPSDSVSRLEKLEQKLEALITAKRQPVTSSLPANGLPTKPRSWADAATAGLTITSNRTPPTPPPNQIINAFRPSQVIIRSSEGKKPFDRIKPTEIVLRVNEALAQLEAKINGKQIEVKGASVLPSGSIKFFAATRAEANWLLENRTMWTTLADPDLITTPAVFPAVIDSVPMEFYTRVDEIKEILAEQNPIPAELIQSIRWLSKPHPKQRSGSIIINILDKELTNRMVRGSVYFEGNSLRVRACKKNRVQCYRCQEPGHISMQCKNELLCRHCGENHDSRTCQTPPAARPHCVRCINQDVILNPDNPIDKNSEKYAHSASSTNCPIRSKSLRQPSSSPSKSC